MQFEPNDHHPSRRPFIITFTLAAAGISPNLPALLQLPFWQGSGTAGAARSGASSKRK